MSLPGREKALIAITALSGIGHRRAGRQPAGTQPTGSQA